MSPDLFRQIVEARPSAPASRVSALPVSLLVHAIVLAALVVIPLLASDVLPIVRGTDALVMPVIVHPALPSVPAPAVRRAPALDSADAAAAPVNAPSGIGRERFGPATAPVDAAAPEASGSIPGVGLPGGIDTVEIDTRPPAAPSAPMRVSSLIKAPVKIRDVSPVYPALALAAHVQGVVIIEAVIGPTGDVVEAKVLRSKPLLDEAALAAVRQWRYTPTLISGTPVSVILTVTVTFSLR